MFSFKIFVYGETEDEAGGILKNNPGRDIFHSHLLQSLT